MTSNYIQANLREFKKQTLKFCFKIKNHFEFRKYKVYLQRGKTQLAIKQ